MPAYYTLHYGKYNWPCITYYRSVDEAEKTTNDDITITGLRTQKKKTGEEQLKDVIAGYKIGLWCFLLTICFILFMYSMINGQTFDPNDLYQEEQFDTNFIKWEYFDLFTLKVWNVHLPLTNVGQLCIVETYPMKSHKQHIWQTCLADIFPMIPRDLLSVSIYRYLKLNHYNKLGILQET